MQSCISFYCSRGSSVEAWPPQQPVGDGVVLTGYGRHLPSPSESISLIEEGRVLLVKTLYLILVSSYAGRTKLIHYIWNEIIISLYIHSRLAQRAQLVTRHAHHLIKC